MSYGLDLRDDRNIWYSGRVKLIFKLLLWYYISSIVEKFSHTNKLIKFKTKENFEFVIHSLINHRFFPFHI